MSAGTAPTPPLLARLLPAGSYAGRASALVQRSARAAPRPGGAVGCGGGGGRGG